MQNLLRCQGQAGDKCVMVSNGYEALQQVCIGSFDLIICEVDLPVMDGVEFALRMRRLAWHQTTPLVLLAAGRFEVDLSPLPDQGRHTTVVGSSYDGLKLHEMVSAAASRCAPPASCGSVSV